MPVPTKAQLQPIVDGLMKQNKLEGENAPDLAAAIAETLANALQAFQQQMMVAPGIPSSPAATAAPGSLI